MPIIEQVGAREILDSRGNPTVEVEVALIDGTFARAAVPSGASTGEHEAVELRDGGDRYGGKGVKKAVQAVLDEIAPAVIGLNADDQRLVDQALLDLDGTPDKSRLGANAILGVSLAVAKSAADSAELPLFRYLGGPNAHILPVPMMNILNGGAHADTGVDIQEFMVAPIGAPSFYEALRWGAEVYHSLKSVLKEKGLSTGLGDEGGFAPDVARHQEKHSTSSAIAVESRPASSSAYRRRARSRRRCHRVLHRRHRLQVREARTAPPAEMAAVLRRAASTPTRSFPSRIRSSEDDWDGWVALTDQPSANKIQLVGDDLFVTNPERLEEGIVKGAANALLVKVNQIGTLTETLDAVDLAHRNGYKTMMSHRSAARPRTPPSPTSRLPSAAARSRPVLRHAASALPSTTSCCASKKPLVTPPDTRGIWRSPGTRRRPAYHHR